MMIIVCPNEGDGRQHRVKWNSGDPWCLSCNVAAVTKQPDDTVTRVEFDLLMAERDRLKVLLEEARSMLRWVRSDRPSAHSDALWRAIDTFLRTEP